MKNGGSRKKLHIHARIQKKSILIRRVKKLSSFWIRKHKKRIGKQEQHTERRKKIKFYSYHNYYYTIYRFSGGLDDKNIIIRSEKIHISLFRPRSSVEEQSPPKGQTQVRSLSGIPKISYTYSYYHLVFFNEISPL